MIVRRGAELSKFFETILSSGYFGKYDWELAKLNQADPSIISQNPRDREGVLDDHGNVAPSHNTFEFWLPHGLSTNDELFSTQLRE